MITSARGFNDTFGAEGNSWSALESVSRTVFTAWGFSEIRLPIVEKTELFARGIGDATDIVEKEMYVLTDRGGENLALRPEGTAGAIRFYNEHKLWGTDKRHKMFYIGPMFRCERPQKGRLRQFHQAGIEYLGDASPSAEADCLLLADDLLRKLGIGSTTTYINSIGCVSCRPAYKTRLVDHFCSCAEGLCDDCKRRKELNPLRLLDCKNEKCRERLIGVPKITEHLCNECSAHFNSLRSILDAEKLDYEIDPFIVRGLDYYNRTVFEVHSKGLGSQSAVLAGGRYDLLSATLGGQDTPAVGWAAGIERLISLIHEAKDLDNRNGVFVIALGDAAVFKAREITFGLRRNGIRAEFEPAGGSMKSQMRRADKLCMEKAIIIGEDELSRGVAIMKNLLDGTQTDAPIETLIASTRGFAISPFIS